MPDEPADLHHGSSDDWDRQIHAAEDVYHQASLRWGGDAQFAKAAEEFAELSAVCARAVNDQSNQQELLEELIDARIMIEQIAQHITDQALESEATEQLGQLDDRLKEGGQV